MPSRSALLNLGYIEIGKTRSLTRVSPHFSVTQFVPPAIVAIAFRKWRRVPKGAANSVLPAVSDSVAASVVVAQAGDDARISRSKYISILYRLKGKV